MTQSQNYYLLHHVSKMKRHPSVVKTIMTDKSKLCHIMDIVSQNYDSKRVIIKKVIIMTQKVEIRN